MLGPLSVRSVVVVVFSTLVLSEFTSVDGPMVESMPTFLVFPRKSSNDEGRTSVIWQ